MCLKILILMSTIGVDKYLLLSDRSSSSDKNTKDNLIK